MPATTESPHLTKVTPERRALELVLAVVALADLAFAWSDVHARHAVPWTRWAQPVWLVGLLFLTRPNTSPRWPTVHRRALVATILFGAGLAVARLWSLGTRT